MQGQVSGRAVPLAEHFSAPGAGTHFAGTITGMRSLDLLDLSDTTHAIDALTEDVEQDIPEHVLAEFGGDGVIGIGLRAMAELTAALVALRPLSARPLLLAHSEAVGDTHPELIRIAGELAAVRVHLIRGEDTALGIGVGGFNE